MSRLGATQIFEQQNTNFKTAIGYGYILWIYSPILKYPNKIYLCEQQSIMMKK